MNTIPKDAVVQNSDNMISDNSTAMRETLYLLNSPANAEKLLQAIADLEAGRGRAIDLDELKRL